MSGTSDNNEFKQDRDQKNGQARQIGEEKAHQRQIGLAYRMLFLVTAIGCVWRFSNWCGGLTESSSSGHLVSSDLDVVPTPQSNLNPAFACAVTRSILTPLHVWGEDIGYELTDTVMEKIEPYFQGPTEIALTASNRIIDQYCRELYRQGKIAQKSLTAALKYAAHHDMAGFFKLYIEIDKSSDRQKQKIFYDCFKNLVIENNVEVLHNILTTEPSYRQRILPFYLDSLHVAIEFNCLEIFDLMLDLTKDISAVTTFYSDELYNAIKKGNLYMVKRLIEQGYGVNDLRAIYDMPHSLTPLQFAITLQHVEIVNLLLLSGADPNVDGALRVAGLGMTLKIAVKSGSVHIVKSLIAANVEFPGFFPFLEAALKNHDLPMLRTLLDAPLQSEYDRSARKHVLYKVFETAALADNRKQLSLLVATGKIDADCITQAIRAVNKCGKHPVILEHLLTFCQSLDIPIPCLVLEEILESATKQGYTGVIELLQKHGAVTSPKPSDSPSLEGRPPIIDGYPRLFGLKKSSDQKETAPTLSRAPGMSAGSQPKSHLSREDQQMALQDLTEEEREALSSDKINDREAIRPAR